MVGERPQFYANNLTPVPQDELSGKTAELRDLINKSLKLIEQEFALSPSCPSIDNGNASAATQNALALLYIYLAYRQPSSASQKQKYLAAASQRLVSEPVGYDNVAPRRLSPLNNESILGDFVAVAIVLLNHKDTLATDATSQKKLALHCNSLIQVVNFATDANDTAKINPLDSAVSSPVSGIDEVLQGRAGLLWGLLLLRQIQPEHSFIELKSLFSRIPSLAERIVTSGIRGWNSVTFPHTDVLSQPKPQDGLLWPWINTYYGFGAMHGATGILSVLLACPEAEAYHAQIAASITYISSVCIQNQGHLPMSEPPFPSKQARPQPLVQLCHGATGLALLLCLARENEDFFQKYVRQEWIEAEGLARKLVWREGLLSKGLGVCHGVAGTALPWVLGAATAPEMLRSAVALLLDIGAAAPLGKDERFREPDSAFGIMEGLVGTVMVWREAMLAIEGGLGQGQNQMASSSGQDRSKSGMS